MHARLVIAGTHSGVGKTTVATGLMTAFTKRGLSVASAKVGPDFIDPGYHRLATGRPGRNLDSFLCGTDAIRPLGARAAEGSDLLIVEGVMGLFDGVGSSTESSTAHIASMLEAPVILVVDAAAMSSSVRALVDGFHHHFEQTHGRALAGVVLNRVGSDTHESLLREALATSPVPVVGALRRGAVPTWRDRHLGLVPVVEDPARISSSIEQLSLVVTASLDLDAIERLARAAGTLRTTPLAHTRAMTNQAVPIAVLGGPAFSFAYPDNLERLVEAGAELVMVDPANDAALPEGIRGLYACGGFPEVFAAELAANETLLHDVRTKMEAGLAVWAECGGLLWLSRSLDGHRLCGAIAATGTLGSRVKVGYRTAVFRTDSPIGPVGTVVRGHEHHYSNIQPAGDAMETAGSAGARLEGWATNRFLASYLHLHLGGDPLPAERFVATAAR